MLLTRLIPWLCTCFLTGCALSSSWQEWPGFLSIIICCTLLLLLCKRLKIFCVAPLFLAFLWIGGEYVHIWRLSYQPTLPFEEKISFEGTIVELPEVRSNATFLTVLPQNQLSNARIQVKTMRYPSFSYGDRIVITNAKIERPEAFNGFDYPLFLERFGIVGIVRRPGTIRLTGHSPPSRITERLYRIRLALESHFNELLPEPESSFLSGVMLGSKRAIPDEVLADLQATGTSHIIAISGANITILLGLILQFLPITTNRSKWIGTVVLATGITVMTGGSASVLRGAAVAILSCSIRFAGRQVFASPLIIFTMLMLILNNPLLLAADPGFQLSFGAFAGLAYTSNMVTSLLSRSPLSQLPEVITNSLAETIAATLGTLPLSFKLFGQLPFLAFIVNPLILWLLPPITFLGILISVFAWLPFSLLWLTLPIWLALHAILSIVGWFGIHASAWTVHGQIQWPSVFILYGSIWILTKTYHARYQ